MNKSSSTFGSELAKYTPTPCFALRFAASSTIPIEFHRDPELWKKKNKKMELEERTEHHRPSLHQMNDLVLYMVA